MVEEQIQQGKAKGIDEIFCRTCGAIIKKQAEICPHCGVRNITVAPPYVRKHNPALYQTTVSGNWYYGVIICTILWLIWIISTIFSAKDSQNTLSALAFFIGWIGLPITLYFDIQYVRGNNDKWNPETAFWVIGGFIWFLNLIVVLIYIIRRKESLDGHSAVSIPQSS